ncbi:hypothetical protein [Tistrella mobilis]|uniref:Uncharacterized protein n=1 Tax=Tistrella mobilis (strain KA081020-065) TaxID=1110502 RepID=I3TX67_TISMK|nr:hypothetical protein [Tistrella mobilis]AFK57355.1 hypothetical protein TMO_c0745 [Tistrella mobilis KA081020-065]
MSGTRLDTAFGPIVFFAFVIAGAGFIMAAKLMGLPAGVVTGVPVVLMLCYAAALLGFRRLRLRADQNGDNLYYMGFLYTLVSLGASLYQFSADGAADEIVRNFGIAIASTITGVALRVMFNQMRVDPIEVEHTARIELADAARKLRRELDRTVLELSHFRRATEQVMGEGFEEILNTTRTVSERLLAEVETAVQKAVQPIEAVSQSSSATLDGLTTRVSASLGDVTRRLAEDTDGLAASAGRVTSSLGETAERLRAMQTPEQLIRIQLQPTVDALAGAAAGFERASHGNTEALIRAIGEVERAARAREAAGDEVLGETRDGLRRLAEAMERAEAGNRRIAEALAALAARDHVQAVPVASAETFQTADDARPVGQGG